MDVTFIQNDDARLLIDFDSIRTSCCREFALNAEQGELLDTTSEIAAIRQRLRQRRASRDIEAIADYLATQSGLNRAERFLKGIDSTLQRIAQFPQIGRKRDELYPDLRSLSYAQYLIFYRLLDV
jgi:plasmid stabilization system protein ParE